MQEEADQQLFPLLKQFIIHQETKENSFSHIKHVRQRLPKLFVGAKWKRFADITPSSFNKWLTLTNDILCKKTQKEYLGHLSAFLNWLVMEGTISANPLLGRVEVIDSKGEMTFERRSFTDVEMNHLRQSPKGRGWIYLAATMMGLRRNEFNQLRWDDVKLDTPKPYLIVPASISKNHRTAHLEMPQDAIDAFKALKAGVYSSKPKDPVLPRGVPSMKVFRDDLKQAGIPYIDEMKRRADFHALRHTTATRMLAAGISPRVVMEFMRHSDMKLTTKTYTDALNLPMSTELQKLPSLLPPAYQNSVNSSPIVSNAVHAEKSGGSLKAPEIKSSGQVLELLTKFVQSSKERRGGDSNPRYGYLCRQLTTFPS
jgi:integrase